MSNSQFIRPISLPVGWQKVRIGARMLLTSTNGASLTGGAVFAMGLCSGTSNGYGDVTTGHFVGMIINADPLAISNSLTYQSYNTGNPAGIRGCVRVGTTNNLTTNMGVGGANFYIAATAQTQVANRQLVFLDITKGSPNYTFRLPFWSCQTPSPDSSATDFQNIMAQASPQPANYYNASANSGFFPSLTLAVDETTNGTLNAVNFFWNRADESVELCDIGVSILA